MEKIILNELAKPTEQISSSSSESDISSSSEDDVTSFQKRIKIENYIENVVYQYSNQEFRSHFRVSRLCCEDLILLYGNQKSTCYRGAWPEISAEKTVLILWYLANNESFR